MWFKVTGLFLILFGSGLLIYFIIDGNIGSHTKPSLTQAFTLLGKPARMLDSALAKVIPVNVLDEKELGEALAAREPEESQDPRLSMYLEDCVRYLSKFVKKPFYYRVFLYQSDVANAFALPGGIIYISRGLVESLHSESELISVLAHEIGHIELGHSFLSVKFELLSKKMHVGELGKLADFARDLLFRHTFSKTQEDEADEYAFALMTESDYDPLGQGLAFNLLLQQGESDSQSVIQEYFATHPALHFRADKSLSHANQWWKSNPHVRRYIGERNLAEKVCMTREAKDDEWAERGR